MARTSASSKPLTDHDEIRRWAEERGAKPSCVRGTGNDGDVGMIRLDFPGYTGEGKLEEISWDEWFDKFDESGLALLVQDETARGQQSNFNKLVSRETAAASNRNRSQSRGRQRKTSTTRSSSGARRSANSGRTASQSGRSRNVRSIRARKSSGKKTTASRSSRTSRKAPTRATGKTSRTSRGSSRRRAA